MNGFLTIGNHLHTTGEIGFLYVDARVPDSGTTAHQIFKEA